MRIPKIHKKTNENVEQQNVDLDNFLDKNTEYSDLPNVTERPSSELRDRILKDDHDTLNKVLLETLCPQLESNEEQKRSFKQKLMSYVKGLIIAQSILVAIPILCCCAAVCFDIPFMNDLTNDTIKSVFNFLQYYITAVVAEFLTMLFFIVKYVFDKSIVDLTGKLLDK